METKKMGKAVGWAMLTLLLIFILVGYATAQTCIKPPAGLVSWWPGDGNARDIVGSNHGTLQGGTTFAPGLVGQAFSVDGIDDYVIVPHNPSLNLASGLTIEAWINSASTDGPRVILSKWNDNTGDWSYIFKDHNASDKLRIGLSKSIHSDLADLQGSTSIPLGTWVHVATTYDSTEGTVRLYFNGVEDASLTVGPGQLIDSSLTDLLIGAVFTGGGIHENFAGLIDEVGIYNRALSASEIQAIFNAGSAGKCVGPPPPVCDIQLNKTTFVNGDQVIAQVARLANPGQHPVPVEVKLWFELPGSPPPVPFLTVGADGSFVLPPGFNNDFGPLPLATVQASFPRGPYSFNCRLLHAVTGAPLTEDFNPFQLQ